MTCLNRKERGREMYSHMRFLRFCVGCSALLMLGMVFLSIHSVFVEAAERTKPVDLSTAIIQVAKQNVPAVVYIEVTESREVTNPFLPFENDPFFRRFFGAPKCPRSSNKK